MSGLEVRHRAAMDLIYPLADALQIKLIFTAKGEKNSLGVIGRERMRISGSHKMDLPVSEGYTLDMDCVVEASHIDTREAWVMLHVRRDLWVLLGYARGPKKLYFWIIDGGIRGLGPSYVKSLYDGTPMAYVWDKLNHSKSVKAMYSRKKGDETWSRCDASVVDKQQAGKAEKQDRAADQAGGVATPSI